MRFLNIIQVSKQKFLNTYVATYMNEDNKIKKYEIISRKPNLDSESFCNDKSVTAVGMIMFNEDKTKILLEKEFRLACDSWVYNFPAGLIDEGETEEQAAIRELREETGLELYNIIEKLPRAYTAIGISNETSVTIVGQARGEFGKSTSVDEEIESAWYTKEEVKELLKSDTPMSLRTQSFLYLWSRG